MAFKDGQGVMTKVERLIKSIYENFGKDSAMIAKPLPTVHFPWITYSRAMAKFGSDKPDIRLKGLVSCHLHIS